MAESQTATEQIDLDAEINKMETLLKSEESKPAERRGAILRGLSAVMDLFKSTNPGEPEGKGAGHGPVGVNDGGTQDPNTESDKGAHLVGGKGKKLKEDGTEEVEDEQRDLAHGGGDAETKEEQRRKPSTKEPEEHAKIHKSLTETLDTLGFEPASREDISAIVTEAVNAALVKSDEKIEALTNLVENLSKSFPVLVAGQSELIRSLNEEDPLPKRDVPSGVVAIVDRSKPKESLSKSGVDDSPASDGALAKSLRGRVTQAVNAGKLPRSILSRFDARREVALEGIDPDIKKFYRLTAD
jgi:hypothetical protein